MHSPLFAFLILFLSSILYVIHSLPASTLPLSSLVKRTYKPSSTSGWGSSLTNSSVFQLEKPALLSKVTYLKRRNMEVPTLPTLSGLTQSVTAPALDSLSSNVSNIVQSVGSLLDSTLNVVNTGVATVTGSVSNLANLVSQTSSSILGQTPNN